MTDTCTPPELGTLPSFLERSVAQLKAEYQSMNIIADNAQKRWLAVYADKSPEAVAAAGRSAEEWYWDWESRAKFLVEMQERFEMFIAHCATIGIDADGAWKYLQAAGVPERFTADLNRAYDYLSSDRRNA
jgi:hypothetical protein